ncbi:porin [Pseudofulvimonas gallinarii]|uniref:Phosphate-selective porin OprO/OprP n=1 Tax=Pseudofulvimonas gallinarii TaxID=634155 RepID=A0A4R3LD03_9GAMM|nr:porin [Pseudofulvimonas gallinarii]TCS97789.1 phosphate-selective porin OprO/OprP [Pseudofulvimonas gallinarii]
MQYQALHAGPLDDDGFRRQRVAATLVSPQGIAFKVDYDFAAGTWADVALQVPFTGAQRLRIGQVKAPLGLETFGSHRDVALLERASLSTLLPGRRVGVKWSAARGASHYTVFAAGDSLDRQERGAGLYARATRAFGASTEWVSCTWVSAADVTGVGSLRLRGRPDVSGLPLVGADSGEIDQPDRVDRIALEAAWDRGPWTVQAEYARLRAYRERSATAAGPLPDIDGAGTYLMASWRPGGQSRSYRDGLFRSATGSSAAGVFELVARLSWLSVEDQAGRTQAGRSTALGASWSFASRWRLQAQVSTSPDDDAGAIHGLRLHYRF